MTLGNMRTNGVQMLAAWCFNRGCDDHRVLDVRLPASKRGTGGLLDEFERNSRGCVVETALKGAVHHPVGKVNVHVKRAVISGFCSRLLAFEFSKSTNFKLVGAGCLDPLDGAGAACFLDKLHRLNYLIRQVTLKCAPHLIFSGRVAVSVKYHADSNEGQY
jgi:hypothetical protein